MRRWPIFLHVGEQKRCASRCRRNGFPHQQQLMRAPRPGCVANRDRLSGTSIGFLPCGACQRRSSQNLLIRAAPAPHLQKFGAGALVVAGGRPTQRAARPGGIGRLGCRFGLPRPQAFERPFQECRRRIEVVAAPPLVRLWASPLEHSLTKWLNVIGIPCFSRRNAMPWRLVRRGGTDIVVSNMIDPFASLPIRSA